MIHIEDARVNNLKNLTLDIPRGQFTVITGVSGSGKSSLAFDTLFTEGQRQYLETLSIRSRTFLHKIKQADVRRIQGLPPTVAVAQRSRRRNPRSTVATVTEIDDYLRLLYARCGTAHCFQCGQPIQRQSSQRILQELMKLPSGTRLMLLAPIVRGKKGEHISVFQKILKEGFVRVRVDGKLSDIEPLPKLAADSLHDIEAVIDRIVVKEGVEARLAESLRLALKHGEGTVIAVYAAKEPERARTTDGTEAVLWQDIPYSTLYACPSCNISYLELEPRTFNPNSPYGACPKCEGAVHSEECPECHGTRLRQEARNVLFCGKKIYELYSQTIEELLVLFQNVVLEPQKQVLAAGVLEQINNRLQFMVHNGLDYLTLDRPTDTLSGGEYQRVRLANALGNALNSVCYVLDEPSAGLHPRDNQRLLDALRLLQKQGNTVIAVEHDEAFIRQADELLDLGPGAGKYGGKIVYQGSAKEPVDTDETLSLTLQYLTGKRSLSVPKRRRKVEPARMLTLHHCTKNNLKDITVAFPLGTFICVTGVSGSGKSSLITDTLIPALQSNGSPTHCSLTGAEQIAQVIGVEQLLPGQSLRSSPATYSGVWDEVRKLFALTREAKRRGYTARRFSFNDNTKQGGGRCEVCQGTGTQKIEIDFLSDYDAVCPACNGKHFNRQTLEIRYKSKTLADVLAMPIDDAATFFENVPKVHRRLQSMSQAGLGYLVLGQSASTLSGGELQRLQLATELARPQNEQGAGTVLYVLDEPTTGLHLHDVQQLLGVLNRLVDSGSTVIVVEHHLDVMKTADYIVDLGPEGGKNGGFLTAAGTPEEVAALDNNVTAMFLRNVLQKEC